MSENDVITFDNLPEAVQHLLREVTYIKNHLLNKAATPADPNIPVQEKELLTVEDVSKMLDISKGAVYNMISKQKIPCFKRGGRVYFDKTEIEEWIRTGRKKTLEQLRSESEYELDMISKKSRKR